MHRFCIKSECLKFVYNRWLLLCTTGILIFIPAMVLTLDSFAGEAGDLLYRSKMMQGFYLGQAGYCVLAALYFGQEYLRSTLRTALLCVPKRFRFLTAKLICVLIWTVILLFAVSLISVLTLHFAYGTESVAALIRCMIPAYLSTLELTLLTAAIVILTRSQIVSIAILISLILGFGSLLLQYSSMMRYLPVLASMNSFMIMETPTYLPVWQGIAVQGLWCAVLLLIAGVVFWKRYVR
ncbi:MAG: ABC transporter permease [Oscillospiraceae bacterium]|nr:ABC transporter permease [Oscillospiraceae bacterium]